MGAAIQGVKSSTWQHVFFYNSGTYYYIETKCAMFV